MYVYTYVAMDKVALKCYPRCTYVDSACAYISAITNKQPHSCVHTY
jgi:hypothetical protein